MLRRMDLRKRIEKVEEMVAQPDFMLYIDYNRLQFFAKEKQIQKESLLEHHERDYRGRGNTRKSKRKAETTSKFKGSVHRLIAF